MRTFLVTGGAGSLVRTLPRPWSAAATVSACWTTSAPASCQSGRYPRPDRIHRGRRRRPAAVARAVEGVDCVFHEAALASVPRSIERPLDTNAACVTGTVTLLDAARRAGVRRVVYAGSSSAYGDQPASSSARPTCPPRISPYGAAKLAAEYYCQAFAATFGSRRSRSATSTSSARGRTPTAPIRP